MIQIRQVDFVIIYNAAKTSEDEARVVREYPECAARLINELRHWYSVVDKRIKELKEPADA